MPSTSSSFMAATNETSHTALGNITRHRSLRPQKSRMSSAVTTPRLLGGSLVQRVRHQTQNPRALDSHRKLALVRSAKSRAPSRHDAHVRRHEPPKRLGVFVVNSFVAGRAKEALFLVCHG